MLDKLQNIRVILGSGSPRRKELLAGLGFDFEVVVKSIEEVVPEGLAAEDAALYLARLKMSAFDQMLESSQEELLVITADTVVVSAEGEVLGKPDGLESAKAMLSTLSGKKHRVITGVDFRMRTKNGGFLDHSFSDFTDVFFNGLTEEEISFYASNFEVLDKAGAYGIQDWIGKVGIRKVEGSFYNVMGLPIDRVYHCLKDFF